MANWKEIFLNVAMAVLFAIGAATPSTAHAKCDKPAAELLKFALDNAPSNFSAIKGKATGGGGYNITRQFCNDTLILQDYPATDKSREYWAIEFDLTYSGTPDKAAMFIVEDFSSILKSKGFSAKPILYPSEFAEARYEDIYFVWEGPSSLWVSVGITLHHDTSTLAIMVGHNVN
jgi:hypothetical protein